MMTLGELLRMSRTEKNISLDMLEEATKVSKTVLRSFEENRIDPTLAPVYVRGFLVSYCRYVGIDEHEALGLYEELRKTQGLDEEEAGEQARTSRWRLPLLVILLAVVALLGYVGFVKFSTTMKFTVSPQPPHEEALPSAPQSEEPEPEPALETPTIVESDLSPLQEPLTSEPAPAAQPLAEQPVTVEEEAALVEEPDVAAPRTMRIQLMTIKEAWIEVAIDDDLPNDKIYPPGNSISWEADEKIELRLGNAGGVALVVNGIPMKPFGRPNQVMRLTFKDNTVSINRGEPQDLEAWRAVE